MKNKLSRITKAYLISYTGIPILAWYGIAINFIETTLSGVFYFLSYYFVHALKYDVKTAGIFIASYGLGAIFGGFLGGKMSDKLSPNLVSSLNLMIQAVAFMLLTKISSVYLIVIDVFLLGLSSYAFTTANYIWTLSHCKDSQTSKLRALNILSVISNLALGLSAIIVGLISSKNFYYLFISNGAIFLLLAIFLIILENQKYQRKTRYFLDNLDKETKKNGVITPEKNHYKVLMIVLIAVFFAGAIVSQVSTTYSLYVESAFPEYGLSGFSVLFMVNTFLVVTMQTPIGEIIIKKNALLMVGIGSLLLGLGMGLVALSSLFSMLIVACIIYTIGEMLLFSMAQLVCYEHAPESKKGQQLGLFRMVFAASRVAGPLLGGIIYYHLGGDVLWYLSGVLGMLCFSLCVYHKKLVHA